jgi:membrane protein YqaA with SNARE-associated domain
MDWTLFLSALVSSTLFPGGSEAVLLLRLRAGGDPATLVAIATAGNLLGSLITYALGRAGHRALSWRCLRVDPRRLAQAEALFGRWGLPVLLFAWLPVIGDPLCLLAGLLRASLLPFVLLVGIGKAARYAALAWLAA